MTEERKHAILFATALLCARRIIEVIDTDTSARMSKLHWLSVFESAARDALSQQDADKAIQVARHMAESFKVGIFPFTGADGRPSRRP